MASFDPREIAVRCAHFIGGRSRDARAELEGFRPSDGGFQS